MISFRSVYISGGDCYLIFWHTETHKYENCKHVASKWSISLIKLIVLNCCQMTFYIIIWVWWWRCSYLVAWFCYQLRAMPGSGRPCLYNPTHVLNWLRIHTTFASPSPMLYMHIPWWFGEWSHADRHNPGSHLSVTGLWDCGACGRTQWWVADLGLCAPCVTMHVCMHYCWLTAILMMLW